MRRPALALALCASFTACSVEPGLDPGDTTTLVNGGAMPAEELSIREGCGDVSLHARNEADTLELSFRAAGVLAAAREEGATEKTTVFTLPDERVVLTLDAGTRVGAMTCDDVYRTDVVIERTFTARAGEAKLTLRPVPLEDSTVSEADLVLRDVVLEDEDGSTTTIESLEWTGTGVGWFAG